MRHVIPTVNRSCKMEPRQPITGSQMHHKDTTDAHLGAAHTPIHCKHFGFTGWYINNGVTRQYSRYGSTIRRNGMRAAVTAFHTECTLAVAPPDANNSRMTKQQCCGQLANITHFVVKANKTSRQPRSKSRRCGKTQEYERRPTSGD